MWWLVRRGAGMLTSAIMPWMSLLTGLESSHFFLKNAKFTYLYKQVKNYDAKQKKSTFLLNLVVRTGNS